MDHNQPIVMNHTQPAITQHLEHNSHFVPSVNTSTSTSSPSPTKIRNIADLVNPSATSGINSQPITLPQRSRMDLDVPKGTSSSYQIVHALLMHTSY